MRPGQYSPSITSWISDLRFGKLIKMTQLNCSGSLLLERSERMMDGRQTHSSEGCLAFWIKITKTKKRMWRACDMVSIRTGVVCVWQKQSIACNDFEPLSGFQRLPDLGSYKIIYRWACPANDRNENHKSDHLWQSLIGCRFISLTWHSLWRKRPLRTRADLKSLESAKDAS